MTRVGKVLFPLEALRLLIYAAAPGIVIPSSVWEIHKLRHPSHSMFAAYRVLLSGDPRAERIPALFRAMTVVAYIELAFCIAAALLAYLLRWNGLCTYGGILLVLLVFRGIRHVVHFRFTGALFPPSD